MRHIITTCIISLLLAQSLAFAQSGAPTLLQYHGRLVDPVSGVPITLPTPVRLQLIQGGTAEENPSKGRIVFTEQVTITPDENGYFEYLIGSNAQNGSGAQTLDADDLDTTQPVYVEMAVMGMNGSAQVMLPRQRLGSVGYALQAADAAVDDRLVNITGDTMTGPLTVQAIIHSSSGGFKFPDGTIQTTAATPGSSSVAHDATLTGNGTSGSPLAIAPNQVVKSINSLKENVTLAAGSNVTITPGGNTLTIAVPNVMTSVVHNATLTGNGTSGSPLGLEVPLILTGSAAPAGVIQGVNTGNGTGVRGSSNGIGVYGASSNGIGVRAQSSNYHIFVGYGSNANNMKFRVEQDGNVRADGAFTSPAADFAEMIEVEPADEHKAESYQPGDVLIISPETGKLTKGSQPYSPLVAGVYSTQPGFLAAQPIEEGNAKPRVPLALVGVVPCRVTTENGPIQIGDLLVTSSTPGYAMKGTDRNRLVGAILGKALQALPSGTGLIKVFVALQ